MTDRYRLTDTSETPLDGPHRGPGTPPIAGVDAWLWGLIAVALALNVTLSVAGHDLLGVPCGGIVIACGAALVVRHRRRKR